MAAPPTDATGPPRLVSIRRQLATRPARPISDDGLDWAFGNLKTGRLRPTGKGVSLPMNTRRDVDAETVDAAGEPTPERRRIPSWSFAVTAVVLGFIWPGGRRVLADMTIELVMIGLLYVAVTRTPAFKDWLAVMPRSARRCGKVVIGAMVFVQLFSISTAAFPLTQWAMYSQKPADLVVSYDLVGYTASGDEVDFVPSLTNRTMSTELATFTVRTLAEQLVLARLDPSEPEHLDETEEELEQVIELLAELHSKRSPDSVVVEVVILRSTFDSEQRRTGDGVTETFWRQQVGLS